MGARIGVEVECYAGYRGEQEPRVMQFGTRSVRVNRLLDRWRGPDHRYFKVEGDDGARYILRHDEREGEWEVTVYDRG